MERRSCSSSLKRIGHDVQAIRSENVKLRAYTHSLEQRIREIEINPNTSSQILIENIPTTENEDLEDIVEAIGNKINMNDVLTKVVSTKRLGRSKDSTPSGNNTATKPPPSILVQFDSTSTRTKFMQLKKKSGKMLEPLKHILQARRIILASSSPRRREVLENIGLKFEVIPSTFDENLDPKCFKSHEDFVEALALGKAKEVADRIEFSPQNPGLIVGADTVVILDSKILGKPASKNIAKQMLQSFSGRSHFVYTGIALITAEKTVTFHEKTEVHMAELTEEVIDAYVNTGEPMDKAGGYGIQGVGGTLVRSVVGDYFNVVGFPLHRFCSALVELYQQR